jgi:hypothetical protein
MTQKRQKTKERYYLRLFSDLLKKKLGEDFPLDQVVDHEQPDFVVARPQGSLGIEITDLTREKHPSEKYSAAEKAGFCDKIVDDARRLCERWGIPPLWVTVWIIGSLDHVRGSTAQRRMSENLARFVKRWCDEHPQEQQVSFLISDMITARAYKTWREEHPVASSPEQVALAARIEEWFDEHPEYENGSASLLQEDVSDALQGIWRIHVLRSKLSLDAHCWNRSPGGVCVGPIQVDSLQEAISGKDKHHDEYRRHCTECWLLIVVDPCDPAKAADIRLGSAAATHKYRANFNRVYFLQLLDELVELQLLG